MFSLFDSGMCMLDFGNSRPAAVRNTTCPFPEMKLITKDVPRLARRKSGLVLDLCRGALRRLRALIGKPLRRAY